MFLSFLDRFRDLGLLLLRIGIGFMFVLHGYPKLIDGPDRWIELGESMQYVGISFLPEFWGFLAAVTELFGGIFLMLGMFTRPAIILLFLTMVVATIANIAEGNSFSTIAHPLKMAILFFSLIFIGPGKISIDQYFIRKASRRR